MSKTIIIIGAGLAGLSAALQAAENGCNVKLVSFLPSERAQSVMEGRKPVLVCYGGGRYQRSFEYKR